MKLFKGQKINKRHNVLIGIICAVLIFINFTPALSQNNHPNDTTTYLNLNENPYPPAFGVDKSIESQFNRISRYTDDETGDSLISLIATKEGVKKDQIIIGEILNQLGIFLGLQAGKGSEFIYSVPGYPVLVNAAAQVGGKIVEIHLNNKKENDLKAIEKAVNNKTAAVYIVNPHNPSGTVSDPREFHDFIHRVSQHALVIVDEAYLEFNADFDKKTAVNNIRQGDNVIVFRTFGKAYGLAGLSIGYSVASRKMAEYLHKQRLVDVHDLNRLSVAAAAAVLNDKEYIPNIRNTITEERGKWNAFLDSLNIPHTDSKANFVYFDAGRHYTAIADDLKKRKIEIGRIFEPYKTWIRITIGLQEENEKVRQDILPILKE